MSNTRLIIEEQDGTRWLCGKAYFPEGCHIEDRTYWVSYLNGPASRGVVGFYARSVEAARAKLA